MKKIIILAFAFIAPFSAYCQGRDTVFAVHKLFKEKRASSNGWSAASTDATSPAKYGARQAEGHPTPQEARQDALAGAAFGTVGLLKGNRYSPEREAEVLKGYAEGWGLPPDVRRKLKRKHFKVTAKDVLAMRKE